MIVVALLTILGGVAVVSAIYATQYSPNQVQITTTVVPVVLVNGGTGDVSLSDGGTISLSINAAALPTGATTITYYYTTTPFTDPITSLPTGALACGPAQSAVTAYVWTPPSDTVIYVFAVYN